MHFEHTEKNMTIVISTHIQLPVWAFFLCLFSQADFLIIVEIKKHIKFSILLFSLNFNIIKNVFSHEKLLYVLFLMAI